MVTVLYCAMSTAVCVREGGGGGGGGGGHYRCPCLELSLHENHAALLWKNRWHRVTSHTARIIPGG